MSEDPQFKSPEERYEDRFTRALGTIPRMGTLGVGIAVAIYLIMRLLHC
jgi:hypothetical protein